MPLGADSRGSHRTPGDRGSQRPWLTVVTLHTRHPSYSSCRTGPGRTHQALRAPEPEIWTSAPHSSAPAFWGVTARASEEGTERGRERKGVKLGDCRLTALAPPERTGADGGTRASASVTSHQQTTTGHRSPPGQARGAAFPGLLQASRLPYIPSSDPTGPGASPTDRAWAGFQ